MVNLYKKLVVANHENTHNAELPRIFESIYREERDYNIDFFKGNFTRSNYQFGYLCGLYIDGDSRIDKDLMSYVSSIIKSQHIKDIIINRRKELILLERKSAIKKFKEALSANEFHFISYKDIKKTTELLKNLSFDSMNSNFLETSKILSDILEQEKRNMTDDNNINFRIIEMIYKDFCEYMYPAFDPPIINFLEEYYSSKSVDFKKDKQYNSYQLISVGNRYDIKAGTLPKLYDKKLKTHIIIDKVDKSILFIVNKLKMLDLSRMLRSDPATIMCLIIFQITPLSWRN